MSYRYVCEPCRRALGLTADQAYLNRIKRESGGFSRSGTPTNPPPDIVRRDETGKPFLVGRQLVNVYETTLTGCSCACEANNHDPNQCTGARQFKVSGRPGSGYVDQLAYRLGTEPIPELIVSAHEGIQSLVTFSLARWFSSTDDEGAALEISLARMRYEDQVKLLRDILVEERPDLMAEKPYSYLQPNLLRLVSFRNKVAHSVPIDGDFFRRSKRVDARNETIEITPDELAEHLDLSIALRSQLAFLPMYLDRS